MKLPTSTAFNVNNQKGFSQFILAIILGFFPPLRIIIGIVLIAVLFIFTPQVFADWSASGSCDFAGFTTISASETFPDEASCRAYIANGNGICKEKADAAGYGFLSYTNFNLTEDCHQTGGDEKQQPAYSKPQPNEPSCRANEYYSNGRCYCNTDYARFNGTCVSIDQWCKATHGANIHGENGKCACDAGYRFLNKACVTSNQWCSATYGGNAYERGGSCYCGTGYVLNEKKICVQEAAKQLPPKPTAASEKSEVQEKPTTAPEAKVLIFGKDVKAGDTIIAEGKSKAVVFLPEGGKVDLKEGAKIKFHSEDEIETISGVFKFLIKHIKERPRIIRSGDAVIAVRGTEFLVEVGDNGTQVKVIEGTVEVSNTQGKGTVQVTTGQEMKTAKGGLPTKPRVFDPKALENWWEGLPKEAPSDNNDLWVGLVTLGVLGGVIFWVFRKIKNALRGKEKSKTVSAVATRAAPTTPKRSFILRWGNIILFILMIVLGFFVGVAKEIEGGAVAAFLALNAFYLVIPIQIVLSIIRIFKKYHRFRSVIWLFIVPIVAFLLVMSFLTPAA